MFTHDQGKLTVANPKLRPIINTARRQSRLKRVVGLALEVGAWLLIPSAYVLVVLIFTLLRFLFFTPFKERPPNFLFPREILVPIAIFVFIALIMLVSFQLYGPFIRLRRLSKRYRLDGHRQLRRAKRDPILYLRAFYNDYEENLDRPSRKTAEELLFLALKGSGPLVTVGRPDEIEPLLGASRIYFYDDQWQAGVEYLMMISSLVVFQADFSEGVSWELGAAKRLLNPKQLVISFLSWSSIDSATRQSMYERIQKQLEERFETSLPAKLGDATFMVFEQDWTPRLVEISKWKRFFFIASAITMIRETLRRHLSARNLALAWVRTALYYLFVAVLVSFPFLAIYLVRSFKSFDIGPNAVFIIFGMLVWAILLLAWCLWGGYVFFIKSLYDRIGNTPSQVIE